MTLTVTTFAVSLTALIALFLAFRIVRLRRTQAIGIGHRDNRELELWIRSHGNLVEYSVFALPLLALLEMQLGASLLVVVNAVAWTVGRVLHPWGLVVGAGRTHVGRFVGTLLTWLSILVMAIANLYLGIIGL